KEQAKKKQDNGKVCSRVLSDKYDVTYFIEPEVTNYTLDRNQEYTQVLKANDTINVYGDTLLQSNHESIITAKNESVVAKVTSQDIKKISYHDYGQTSDIKSGNGYNGETLDQTGLIYLRARYYDPSVSRFVQIDNNYDGEKQSIASQNKYVYTMNNPNYEYLYMHRKYEFIMSGKVLIRYDASIRTRKKCNIYHYITKGTYELYGKNY
ncbi:MAG: RHS repeat-associated core domain-containing protein, partial [Erysipelotrichaceae bacterium]